MADFPKPNKSFNPNAYRSQAAYDAHRNQTKEGQTKEQRPSQPQQSTSRPTQKDTTKAQQSRSQQRGTLKKKDADPDAPHYMSDAELKQWYIDADREYEEKKKAGYHKDYVPAGGHPPDFSKFIKENGGTKRTTGLETSRHAPKAQQKAGQSSKGMDKGRGDAPPNAGAGNSTR